MGETIPGNWSFQPIRFDERDVDTGNGEAGDGPGPPEPRGSPGTVQIRAPGPGNVRTAKAYCLQ